MNFDKTFYSTLTKHLSFSKDLQLNANGDNTVKLIVDTINKFSKSTFIEACVRALSYGNPDTMEFCHRLFNVSCMLVKYRRDPSGHEIIFTPKLLIKVREGDCKKYTTFICSVLKAKGINSVPKVVSYDGDAWEHIYAIVPYPNEKGYLTLDPVNKEQWNTEVNYKKGRLNYLNGTYKEDMSKLSIMGNLPDDGFLNNVSKSANSVLGDLEAIAGNGDELSGEHNTYSLAGLEQEYINGLNDDTAINGSDDIGKRRTKAERKQRRKNFFHFAKGAAFIVPRAAFLGILMLGKALKHTPLKMNLAAKMAKSWQMDGGKKLKAMWYSFGGKPEILRKTIIKASKVQIQGADFSIGHNGDIQIEGIGVVTLAAVGAAIAAATPIIVKVMKSLKAEGVIKPQEAEHAGNVLERVENTATTSDGSLKDTAMKTLENSGLYSKGTNADDGGNQRVQQQMRDEYSSDEKKNY